MNFTTVSRVQQTIRAGDEVEWVRGNNRVKINNAANCVPPLPPEEAKKLNIKINVNWGELMVLLAHARRQYMSAFWSQQNFFTVKLPDAPSQYEKEWGAGITFKINSIMRRSLEYFEVHRSKWAAVVAHGIGPQRWKKPDFWLPDYLAIEDLRVPTDTTIDFRNLNWYAARHIYTPGELLEASFNDKKRNPWDLKGVANILKNYKEINFQDATTQYDWETTPEKLAELVKQDGGYYASDAMPGIPLWHFYFEDNTHSDESKRGWFMRIVPEEATVRGTPNNDKFLWESDTPIASSWKQLLHVQYGDLSNKAPFEYYSVRSLGYALLEPCFYSNLTRNRMLQHLNDNFDVWLRVTDPADKARPQMQEFGNYKVLRTGLQVVGQQERHQVDGKLIDMVMAQLKQLQQEASSSYTQQVDSGTKKEQTAFETNVKMQQVNAMMGALLMTAFFYETQSYREICRRFCLPNSADPDIQEFQAWARKMQIPPAWLDVNLWEVEAVTPLGMGNPTMAQAEAQQFMSVRGAYPPEAQNEILHDFTLVNSGGDFRRAARWAPIDKKPPMSDAQRDAQLAFGTLMQGVPIPQKEGLNPIEQIEVLIPLMAGVVVRIEQRDKAATPDEAAGLVNTAQYIGALIQQLSSDPQQQQRVKQYGDALGKLMNQVKQLAKNGQEKMMKEQQQNGNGPNGELHAKMQARMVEAGLNARIRKSEALLTERQRNREMQQKDMAFSAEQRRKDAGAFAEMRRADLKASTDRRNSRLAAVSEE